MQILFIQPLHNKFDEFKYWGYASHQQFIPLGILYLSSILKKAENVSTDLVDLHLLLSRKTVESETLSDFINSAITPNTTSPPDIVSITCNFNPSGESYELITSRIKKVWPDTITIVGGFLPTGAPELFLSDTNTDYVCIGEGEIALTKFVKSIKTGNVCNIPGIYTKNALGSALEEKHIPRAELVKNLDDIPFPDYDLIERYIDQYDITPILFSRGCPNRCTFCANNLISGKKVRYRSLESITQEIEFLHSKYHKNTFHVYDANPTINKKLFLSIIREVKKRWGSEINFNLFNGVDINYCDDEIIEAIKSCGNSTISFAVESGSRYVLDNLMHKRMDLEKAKYLSAKARELGLITGCYFVLGMPGETSEMRADTFEYARTFPVDWCTFSIATPLPGSRLYHDCISNQIIKINSLKELSQLHTGYRSFDLPELSATEIMQIQELFDKIINYVENYNYRTGNFDRAISKFERVSQHHPFQILAHLMLLKIYRELGATDSDKADLAVKKEHEINELLRSNRVSREIYMKFKNQPPFVDLCNQVNDPLD